MPALATRPVLDMHKAIDENSRVLAHAAAAAMAKNPQLTLTEVLANFLYAVVDVEGVCDRLQADIMMNMGETVGCEIVNTPEEDIALVLAESDKLDGLFDNADLEDETEELDGQGVVVHSLAIDLDSVDEDDPEED